MKKKEQKKNHKKLFLIMSGVVVAILILAVVMIILSNKNRDYTEAGSFDKINQDLLAGELTADEYVDYSLSALLKSDELPSRYQSGATEFFSTEELLKFIEEHALELKSETLQRVGEVIGLSDVEFDMDASANVPAERRGGFFPWLAQDAYAASKQVKILNKVKLSEGGHFLVFYTDTGEDRITDDKADSILDMAEDIVEKYSSELGLEYKYDKEDVDSLKINSMRKLMKANGVDDSILKTAMPIYVINTHQRSEGVIAYYLSKYGGHVFGITENGSLEGVPSFP